MLLDSVYRGINTIRVLEVVEHERDQWQRPQEIIEALNLRDGDTVVDLGCGAGYFSLKLSTAVGTHGRVVADDIRLLPLVFLRIRALLRNEHNIQVIHGDADNPHLARAANAALVVNTYHELANPPTILDSLMRTLAPGGHLVMVDRAPDNTAPGQHELALLQAESDVRRAGFEVLRTQDEFLQPPADHPWWILVARKQGGPR